MKFTFAIQLTSDGQVDREKLVIAASGSEVTWHIALKLLGLLLYFGERPRIEQGVDWHYKPDLVAYDQHGRVNLWIDCGNIAVKKIDRVATWIGADARFVILRRNAKEAEAIVRNMTGKVRRIQRVSLVWFEDPFVDYLARLLDAANRCTCVSTPDQLNISISNRHGLNELQTKIFRSSPS